MCAVRLMPEISSGQYSSLAITMLAHFSWFLPWKKLGHHSKYSSDIGEYEKYHLRIGSFFLGRRPLRPAVWTIYLYHVYFIIDWSILEYRESQLYLLSFSDGIKIIEEGLIRSSTRDVCQVDGCDEVPITVSVRVYCLKTWYEVDGVCPLHSKVNRLTERLSLYSFY